MNLEVHTTEGRYIFLDPFKRKPLVFEAKVAADRRLVTSQKPECRESVSNINPYFRAFSRNILGLGFESMRRTELEESVVSSERIEGWDAILVATYPP